MEELNHLVKSKNFIKKLTLSWIQFMHPILLVRKRFWGKGRYTHSARNFSSQCKTKSHWLEKVPLVWSECSFRATRPGREIHVFTKFYFFFISENINMMRDVNKQLQLVLEDTLFKVFYMQRARKS